MLELIIALIGLLAMAWTAGVAIYITSQTSDKKCGDAHKIAKYTAVSYSIIFVILMITLLIAISQ